MSSTTRKVTEALSSVIPFLIWRLRRIHLGGVAGTVKTCPDRDGQDMHGTLPSEQDLRRRRELTRMRRIATGLLGLMVVTYIATRWAMSHGGPQWLGFIRAFAEAAMVGAIADWFAVTALFRHPFGLPIPHTAIIPQNKERLGNVLGRFIANNFLTPDALTHKLHSVDVASHVADWLADPHHSRALADRISGSVPAVFDALGDEHIRPMVRQGFVSALRRIDLAPVAGRVLGVLVAHRRHQALFDQVIELAGDFLHDNHETIRTKIAARSKWWWPRFVDEQLYHKIVDGIEDTLMDLRDPHHPWRDQFNAAIEVYVQRLCGGDAYRQRADAIRDEVLANPVVLRYVDSVWSDVRERVRADAVDPEGALRGALERTLVALGDKLRRDAEMRATVNSWIESLAVYQLVPQRDKIGSFFAGVVQRWDTDTVVAKLELLVGRDLQFVRINGTVVGGMVGLVIYTLGVAFG
jgi:uncharacterized membrane-anchored protein YjiN (DUF445 family)